MNITVNHMYQILSYNSKSYIMTKMHVLNYRPTNVLNRVLL